MAKEFRWKGLTLEELKKISIEDFIKLAPARVRRTLKRGLKENHKKLLKKILKNPEKIHKTHLRDMIILPQMIGAKIAVYRGGSKAGDNSEKWKVITISPEMVGRRLGEFAITVKKVEHSAPGIGASRGSKHIAAK
ncbi:MAG: 30S ribosomal protein S19 [Candidatus Aenigmarchaeota archaeon]|nr:30S ribosomal protein S19 [Candidatus Aenigmarchaeota archaeon]MCX8190870.1 30S ribosomal protein S19 [Candidatus Aenigmarchaeota archaeon]MDW8159872.1 30S ribosomal protein S19 [Candidatus Aenigmarchaeota archaeon]